MKALISVYDKEGIVEFVKELKEQWNVEIISSGGTAKVLREASIEVKEVSDVVCYPEMLDGRVKTLQPEIHAGILAKRKKKEHMDQLKKHAIATIDIVVVNLYPFEKTIKETDNIEKIIEMIDIGGSTLIRAAAKNCQDVIVVTSPNQYGDIIKSIRLRREVNLEERQKLAVEAYRHTAQYDAIISNYLGRKWTNEIFPENLTLTFRKIQDFRYGENKHQKGSFYETLPKTEEPCIVNAELAKEGKELSYNNILDSDPAIECVKEFKGKECVCAIIKHATPCGIAVAETPLQAWKDAFSTDKNSPFGGIVAFNREIGKEIAKELFNYYLEIIIAPKFTKEALKILEKKKNLRVFKVEGLDKEIKREGIVGRTVIGGLILQERDTMLKKKNQWEIVTKLKPTEKELESMEFAVKCIKHIKSNSVVFVKGKKTVAIGGGQTARVDAVKIAILKGGKNIEGSIMASDAFFPFRDNIDEAAKGGVKSIVQPGGSIRDDEVIEAADEHEIKMAHSKQRYFRH